MSEGVLTRKLRANLPEGDLKNSPYYVFFEPSTERLSQKEWNDLLKGKSAEFIRGTVEIRRKIPNTRLHEVLFCETHVSFCRFEKEVINERESLGGVWLGY